MVAKRRIDTQTILSILTGVCLVVIIALCIKGYQMGLFTSHEKLSAFLSPLGGWAVVAFIVIQIVQVVVPVIPGGITLAAGVLIFGPWYGFLWNYIGICIGSILNFLLARRLGKPFIQKFVSEKTYTKYEGWLEERNRFDKLFALAIFFPVAPDDFLCMLAGLTDMSLKKFSLIILLGKPASIFLYSLGITSVLKWFIALF